MAPKVWFLTGTSSGFGRATTELVLKRGDIAVATLRTPSALADLQAQYPSSQLLVLPLDVTDSAAITTAFRRAKETFGRVDVVYNNAATGALAEVEGTPDDVARRIFDVNFFGAANVSREAVRFFREENIPAGGRIIVMSSAIGIKPLPSVGYSVATKHALEGLHESLAMELDPEWNIKITLIEAGAYATKHAENGVRLPPPPAYNPEKLIVRKIFTQHDLSFGGDLDKAVAKIYELANLENPPMRIPLGKDAVKGIRDQIASVAAELDKYESWSDDLDLVKDKSAQLF